LQKKNMMKKFLLLLAAILITNLILDAQTLKRVINFYNLENLFDTIVDPDTRLQGREDFTPYSAKRYDTEKYYKKLDNLARVLSEIGLEVDPMGASIIGCAEVENERVLKDLVNRPTLVARNYQIVHFDSPDERGIDVAFLYRPDCFKLVKSWVRHENGLTNGDKTRDMLAIEGYLDGELMFFIVDHWPSRRGGQKRSAPLRDTVAKHDRAVIDSIQSVHPNAKIVFMGDLNDDPVNKSVTQFMKAKGDALKLKEGELFNPFYSKFKKGNGTLAYNDSWNLFDQIMFTQNLLNANEGFKYEAAYIFKKKYMFQQSGRFEGYPLRTFVGDEFMNGYSDHFPTYIIISKSK